MCKCTLMYCRLKRGKLSQHAVYILSGGDLKLQYTKSTQRKKEKKKEEKKETQDADAV